MAAEINDYEKVSINGILSCEYCSVMRKLSPFFKQGSVAHIYLTSDGGMNLETVYEMTALLEPHVKIVNHEELTEMARQKVLMELVS